MTVSSTQITNITNSTSPTQTVARDIEYVICTILTFHYIFLHVDPLLEKALANMFPWRWILGDQLGTEHVFV
jgi:hypothetical protein